MKYIITTDGDCHRYVIPADKKSEWSKWMESEDAELGHVPDWAYSIGGDPSQVEFENPSIDGELIFKTID